MNLLIFVMALLMVLSSMSYHALDSFLTDSLLRLYWDHYMRVEAPCAYDDRVTALFVALKKDDGTEEDVGTPDSNNESEKKPPEAKVASEGTTGFNVRFLIHVSFVGSNPEQAVLMTQLLERLVAFLYGSQEFYQKIIAERPEAIKEMLEDVRKVNEERKKKKISSTRNIEKLSPTDPVLRELWGQLLRSNPVDLAVLEVLLQQPAAEIRKNLNNICLEVSLYKYLSDKNLNKLRVYLIPRGLLYAILQDRKALTEVIQMRENLHREVVRGKAASDATVEFTNFCKQFPGMNEFEKILDFTVTGTNTNYAEEF